jgi:Holliday junction resolvase RusA-like endonuclease
MNGKPLFDLMVSGEVSTNSNRTTIHTWREALERFFASLHLAPIQRRKISVELKFFLAPKRIYGMQKNDLDNLAKPVLDAMKRIEIIRDDADIFRLEVTKFPTNGEEGVYVRVRDWD